MRATLFAPSPRLYRKCSQMSFFLLPPELSLFLLPPVGSPAG